MYRYSVIFIIGLWVSPLGLTAGKGHMILQEDEVEMNFHLFDGKIVLPIEVEDRVVLNFVVDTGVNQPILLNRDWAKRLGWNFHRTTRIMGAGSSRKISAKVTLPTVKLGLPGMAGTDFTFLVLQEDPLKLGRYDIHGLIGAHLFMDMKVEIDYSEKTIRFAKHLTTDYLASYKQVVNLHFQDLKPYVKATLNHETDLFLLDLGSEHEVLVLQEESGLGPVAFRGQGFGGNVEAYASNTRQFELDGVVWSSVDLVVMKPKRYSNPRALQSRKGSIGSGLFKDQLILLDYKLQKMYLKPNRSAKMNRYKLP